MLAALVSFKEDDSVLKAGLFFVVVHMVVVSLSDP